MKMCFSIETEAAARLYVAELRRAHMSTGYIQSAIRSWQQANKWLLDYDLTTCERIVKPKVEPVWKRGMDKLKACILEISRTPVLCPEERARAKARETVA
jgi:hypothetical protein